MDYAPLSLDNFPAQLRRNVDPSSPPPMRMMAARGLVPAAPGELAMVLYQLSLDSDAQVADAARKTMAGAPDNVVTAAAASPLDGQVLDFIAALHKRATKTLEAVLLNRAALDATFVWVAELANESLTELIASNDVRLLRTPAIIESLYMNPKARMSTLDRVVDLAKRNGVKFEGLAALQQLVDDPRFDTAAAAKDSAEREAQGKDFREVLEESLKNDHRDSDEIRKELKEDEKEDKKSTKSLQTKLLEMSISEKVRMAMLGSAQEREFLVKDNNKLVHMAAVTSPKLSVKDIVSWSGNRLVPDTVLAYIANHRRYRRMYNVVVNLANNPKTPVKTSYRLVPQLVDRDLKAILRNRNVPAPTRRQAKEILGQRSKRKK